MAMELAKPNRQELEAMDLADSVALENAFSEAHDLIVGWNDEKMLRLADADGMTQQAIAVMAGLSQSQVSKRLKRVRDRNIPGNNEVPQNGDGPAETVDGTAEEEGPAHFLPDVVADDALENLRTQTMHWISQGKLLEELMEDGAVIEPRSREDKAAIKREASHMAAIARRLKGAF